MGAQSDFVSATFDPSQQFKAEQVSRARILMGMGIASEQIAEMLSIPVEVVRSISAEEGKSAR
jgi:hypothetical protein